MPVEADIVYVDPSYDTTDVPPLAESFLQQGFRIILPLFSSVQVKPGSVLTVERMVHCVGSVLIEVRRRDALLKYSSPPRNNQNMPSPAPSVVSPVESPTGRSRPEPLRRSTTDNKPVKPALKHKAIYILGIGLGGLVAAHYACHVSPYSTTTSSAQFTRLQRLQAKVINTASCFTGPDLESSAPTPYPTFRALILLSPSLEYQSPTTRATLSVVNFANGMQDEASGCLPRLRMRQPASDAREAARRLKAKTGLIRQPTLILHGDKDPITSQKAVNFFYDHLGSRDKCLAIYPGRSTLALVSNCTFWG